MNGQAVLEGIAAEEVAGDGREQWLGSGAVALGEPDFEDADGQGQQGCASFLAALADGVDVRAGAERHVGQGQGGQFGDPQPGLDRQQQQGVIATPGPVGSVAGCQQRVGLLGWLTVGCPQ